MSNDILLVGFEENFYMFDTIKNENLLSLKLSFYFGHFYQNNNLVYVADASSIHCIHKNGKIKWQTDNLGIDGVVINEIDDQFLFCSGEWDPPGGWIDFILEKQSGMHIKNTKF